MHLFMLCFSSRFEVENVYLSLILGLVSGKKLHWWSKLKSKKSYLVFY